MLGDTMPGGMKQQAGFSLVELMIAITLGLFLLGGLLGVYVATINGHGNVAKLSRLDSELHGVMELMERDIRRAGANGDRAFLTTGAANPFVLEAPQAYPGEAADSCLTFSYDLDNDGVLDTGVNDERFGFRLRNAAVQMRRAGLDCTVDGDPENWEDISDPHIVEITHLNFQTSVTTSGDVTVRSVNLELSGRLKNDPAMTRTYLKTVKVRNDLYSPS